VRLAADMGRDEAMNESTLSQPEIRLGVIICECGDQIAGRLDTELLRQWASALPDVVYSVCDVYPCSKDGQARLHQAIADQSLDRALIAGCTPRLVEKLFREAGRTAGLPEGCVEVVNIREHCAYIHTDDPQLATQTAAALIEMGVARLSSTSLPRAYSGRIVKSALVIGSSLSGLTAALALANNGIGVTLVEQAERLGHSPHDLADQARAMLNERIETTSHHPHIHTLLNAHVSEVTGRPGDYEVRVDYDDQSTTLGIGAIVVASDERPAGLGTRRWFDRRYVVTQAEFEAELETGLTPRATEPPPQSKLHDIVMILCAEEPSSERCSRLCCMVGIRQAIRAKQINPNANVTILFRDLYLGGSGDLYVDELEQARKLGVVFFRYRKDHPPTIGDKAVGVFDPLTAESLRVPFDCVVLSMPLEPPDGVTALAALLHVPQDKHGFMIEPRVRLRPGRYADDGVYVLGGAHQPVDDVEALFQAHVASSRVMRFLSQDMIRVEASIAEVDAAVCTGCGNCAPVCPTSAITLQKRDSVLSLAAVEALRCIGCGDCVVACPTKAIELPGWDDAAILAQISAVLRAEDFDGSSHAPRIVVLACEWSAYAAADMVGARYRRNGDRRAAYPPGVRIIRMPCSARFDPNHILWAFLNGADGVFLGACPLGECHYGDGNLDARQRVEALKEQLVEHGIDPNRLHLECLAGDDGEKFALAVTSFVETLQ
jgi:heterodisulfide reductase subunit A